MTEVQATVAVLLGTVAMICATFIAMELIDGPDDPNDHPPRACEVSK